MNTLYAIIFQHIRQFYKAHTFLECFLFLKPMQEATPISKKADKILTELLSNSPSSYIQAMNDIIQTMTSDNAPVYLGFIISFLSKKVDLKEEQFNELSDLLSKVIELFHSSLPKSFQNLIPSSDQLILKTESSYPKAKLNIMNGFKQIILESLIKNSKHEIWNSLNIFFKNKGYKDSSIEEDIHKVFENFLNKSDEAQKLKIIREIAYLIEPKDVLKVFQYFDEKREFIEEFFLLLKFTNTTAYEHLMKLIYGEKKFYKENIIPFLPDFQFDKIVTFIKDYNWNVTAMIIERRPEVALDVIKAFHNGELGMQRKFFIDALAEQDNIFSQYLNELKLSTDEITELSGKSLFFAKKYFYTIQTEEQMLQFCKSFTKKFENHIFDFLKEAESTNLFEIFLKSILRTFRLVGELKNYIISKYSTDQRFFHSLLPYLSMSKIETLLEKFYQKDLSIECLLRKSNPQELIIDLHKFKNLDLSALLIEECIKNSKFEDNDWVLAMKSIEQLNSPIKMNTCWLILNEKPKLRSQAIIFIKRSMGESIWTFKRTINDLLKCIEFLGEDSISIFESMTRDEIIFILRKSAIIENNLRKYLSRFNFKNFTSNMRFLDDCLKSI